MSDSGVQTENPYLHDVLQGIADCECRANALRGLLSNDPLLGFFRTK